MKNMLKYVGCHIRYEFILELTGLKCSKKNENLAEHYEIQQNRIYAIQNLISSFCKKLKIQKEPCKNRIDYM